jgi:hypothetical protein
VLTLSEKYPHVYARVPNGKRALKSRRESRWLLQRGSSEGMGVGCYMSLEVLRSDPVQRYSSKPRRSLIAMLSRRAISRVNGSASHILVRPFVVMAARALGPGPTRLRLVKLAHNLDHHPYIAEDDRVSVQPTSRAA